MDGDFNNKLIFGKYKLLKIIGKGSFGFVYRGKNIINEEKVAIKIEDWRNQGDILESEAYLLYYLKGFGIPEIKSFGIYGRYKVLVQTLLGNSLEKEFQLRKNKFSLKDICMVAIQLIDRLEYIHSKYIIHRDIKTDNILIDEETKKIIYLIDFGLAKKYRSARTGRHIKFTIPRRLTGTARYASTNALRGTEQSRRDDLESLGYVLIYLARNGYLPWQGFNISDRLERYRKIYQMKKFIKPEKLCEDISSEFCEYIKYAKNLQFEEKPDYDYLRGLFFNILNMYSLKNDLIFSWFNKKDREKKNEHSRNGSISKRKKSPYSRILRKIQNSREREKNIEKINKIDLSVEIENKVEKRDNNELIKREKKKFKLLLNQNEEKNKDRSKSKISKNENNIDTHSDKLGTQITQFNLSVNMDDIDNNINNNYFELKDREIINESKLRKNKIINLVNNNDDTKKNKNNNTLANRPISFDINNGSFNNAQILKCFSQNNIKTIFIGQETIRNLNNNRTSIKAPNLSNNLLENNIMPKINKKDIGNNNKNSKNKDIINYSGIINSNNINKNKMDNSIRNQNNKNNYIKIQNYNIQNKIRNMSNKSNPNYSISIDKIDKSQDNNNKIKKNFGLNRKIYNSPLQNLKDKYYQVININNQKKNNLKSIYIYNNNNTNNNINITMDTKEKNKNKIKYKNNFLMNDIKNKVISNERGIFYFQKKSNISNNELKSHNINSIKKQKSLPIKNKKRINLYSSKSQDYFRYKKYILKNDLYGIKNFNNINLINFPQYNNINIKAPMNLNKNKKITIFRKNPRNNENYEISNKGRKNYNSPINFRANNDRTKRNINNKNVLNNSNINPRNNNFNIINNNPINARIDKKLIYKNNNNITAENLNNNININEYKPIFNLNKQFLVK